MSTRREFLSNSAKVAGGFVAALFGTSCGDYQMPKEVFKVGRLHRNTTIKDGNTTIETLVEGTAPSGRMYLMEISMSVLTGFPSEGTYIEAEYLPSFTKIIVGNFTPTTEEKFKERQEQAKKSAEASSSR